MVQASTLVAWLGVQDCRQIKDYPATPGGVILQALEATGAGRLLLLSTLQSSFSNAYLESLALAWPGEIALSTCPPEDLAMARLWPFACDRIQSQADQTPGESVTLLLGSGLPACQAVFLTLGMTDERVTLVEIGRDGQITPVDIPRLSAAAPVAHVLSNESLPDIPQDVPPDVPPDALPTFEPEIETDPQQWAVEEVALQPITDLEFPAELVESAELAESVDEPAAVDTTEGVEPADWQVDEVALHDMTEIEALASVEVEAPQPVDDIPVLEFETEPLPTPEPDPFDIESELAQAGLLNDKPTAEALALLSDGPASPEQGDGLASELQQALAALSDDESPAVDAAQAPQVDSPWPYPSVALQTLTRRADSLSQHDFPVLLLGEPGSGTRALADRIVASGARAHGPCVAVQIPAIHAEAQAAELWGEHDPASGQQRPGFAMLAQGGTLLLMGIEALTPLAQAQLLSVMTRGDCLPVGADQAIPVDIRVLATASDTLLTELKAGRFNRQLFDLFGKGLLTVPALRRRPEDLMPLLDALWTSIQADGHAGRVLDESALTWLQERGFEGSVRDLELSLRRACLWADGNEIDAQTLKESMALLDIPDHIADCTAPIQPGFCLKDVVFAVTKHFIVQALEQSGHDLDTSARLLGVSDRQAMLGWMKRVNVPWVDATDLALPVEDAPGAESAPCDLTDLPPSVQTDASVAI